MSFNLTPSTCNNIKWATKCNYRLINHTLIFRLDVQRHKILSINRSFNQSIHFINICWQQVWMSHPGAMDETINKRPMGHIAHLKKQFQSIKTFAQSCDDTIILVKRKNIIISVSFLRFTCNECFRSSFVEIVSAVLKKKWKWKKLTDRQATDKAKVSLKPSSWATVGKPC